MQSIYLTDEEAEVVPETCDRVRQDDYLRVVNFRLRCGVELELNFFSVSTNLGIDCTCFKQSVDPACL